MGELAKLDKKAQHEYKYAARDGDEELQDRKDEFAHKRHELKEHYKHLTQQPVLAETIALGASTDVASTEMVNLAASTNLASASVASTDYVSLGVVFGVCAAVGAATAMLVVG